MQTGSSDPSEIRNDQSENTMISKSVIKTDMNIWMIPKMQLQPKKITNIAKIQGNIVVVGLARH